MKQDGTQANPHIIGLTGSFGSGCSYVAKHILAAQGYEVKSLAQVLRDEYERQHGNNAPSREQLQEFGDSLREQKGPDWLARKIIDEIKAEGSNGRTAWAVDSIRNPKEIYALRNYSPRFFLLGVFADRNTRWSRVQEVYHSDQGRFDLDDRRDAGRESKAHGQRVEDCFSEADVVISNSVSIATPLPENDDFKRLSGRVGQYVDVLSKPLARKQPLRPQEALMAMAYAVSQQSSCLKRKVGAIIVDSSGNVISSGYNEVPSHGRPCYGEHGRCSREVSWDQFLPKLKQLVPEMVSKAEEVRRLFRSSFKILDYCRALHAEENAIVSLARNGRSVVLGECALYTTTYPCRLCANKIANLGIQRVVYREPYPDEEAKVILRAAGVESEFFEGVTFRAYFRIYGEER